MPSIKNTRTQNFEASDRLGLAMAPTVPEPERRKLPRGTSGLPREIVDQEQRKRLVVATAHVVAEKGYSETTVADIIAGAGVSRATFYDLFRDKEECFLYGFEKLSKAHVRDMLRAMDPAMPLPEQLLCGLRAYLRRVDADLSLARAFFAEAESATPRIRAEFALRVREMSARFGQWLQEVQLRSPGASTAGESEITLMTSGLRGFIINGVRNGCPFTEKDVRTICRFAFACFGLYEWAEELALNETMDRM